MLVLLPSVSQTPKNNRLCFYWPQHPYISISGSHSSGFPKITGPHFPNSPQSISPKTQKKCLWPQYLINMLVLFPSVSLPETQSLASFIPETQKLCGFPPLNLKPYNCPTLILTRILVPFPSVSRPQKCMGFVFLGPNIQIYSGVPPSTFNPKIWVCFAQA